MTLDGDADRVEARPLRILMSGGSRGIGLAIAENLAADGASVALLAKTAEPHPKLPGTIYTAAEAIEAAGGRALPIVGDVRDEASCRHAVKAAVASFGGLDVVVNNASAVDLRDVGSLPLRRFDLMTAVNVRGTFALTQAALPHLKRSDQAHVLTLSPPLNADPMWFAHSAYTTSKYGMTIVTLGLAAAFERHRVAANCLWPKTAIATAAVGNVLGGDAVVDVSRTPQLVADAAAVVLARTPAECNGNAYLVEDVLAEEGVTDLSGYAHVPGTQSFAPDFFLDGAPVEA